MKNQKAIPLSMLVVLSIVAVLALIGAFFVAPAQAAPPTEIVQQIDCMGSSWSVSNETELNEAIACYNAKNPIGTYTITLTQDIDLTASTTTIDNDKNNRILAIEGGGFTVDGQGTADVRVFHIAADTTVTIEEITITGGHLTADNDFGAGIENRGDLTLNASTVSNNSAFDEGGGIYNGGTLTVNDTTISGNVAGESGGAGLYIHSGSHAHVSNSTLSGNSGGDHGAGIYHNGDSLVIGSSTIANNSTITGGSNLYIFNGVGVEVSNSILANGSTVDCERFSPINMTDDGHNLVESQNNCQFQDGVNGTIVGQDPALGPLADNGGGTQTQALLTGSPALDAGDTALTTDQRGVARPAGAADDIGAFEAQVDCSQNAWQVGNEIELNEAITCYNAKTTAGTYTINVTQDIDLTASTTTIDNTTAGIGLVIEGGGFAVDGQGTADVRPFTIAANTTVTINDLTVTGGNVTGSNDGGGIFNNGTLTINNSTISDNVAGRYGGGIRSDAILTVNDSTISGNMSGSEGGGINNLATLTVNKSTVSGNTATGTGGGIHTTGSGLQTTINNSTISGNTSGLSGGGIDAVQTTVVIDSTTIAGNAASLDGGGLNSNFAGHVTFSNSIIADNTYGAGSGDCHEGTFGIVVDGGHNLVETQYNCNFTNGVNGNIVGVDPVLGPLADNGGPSTSSGQATFTHALMSGSPAIDAGDTSLTTDQRGVARPAGAADDIGAFEVTGQTGPNLVVNSSADTDDGDCDLLGQGGGNMDCTLREAINLSNILPGPNTITFDIPGADPGCTAANHCTITLGGTYEHIMAELTIDGAANNGHITVDGDNSHPIFFAESDFNLNALTVANGNGFLSSGGLYNAGHTVVVSSSTFIHNSAASGAHVKNDFDGTMTIVNSTFFDVNNGTAIGNVNGTLNIYNSTIDGNNATSSNGLLNSSGAVTLYNTIVSNNEGIDCSGTITADAFNLDNDGTCDNATSKTVAEIDLQAPADNGGPTPTMALGAGSAALEAGDDAVCAAAPVNGLDQRGVVRPQNIQCDVGAFEALGKPGPTLIVNSSADTDDGACDLLGQGGGNMDCTLREAINLSNILPGPNTITFDIPGADPGCTAANRCTITLGGSLPHLMTEVTIDGTANQGHITVDGDNSHPIFFAEDNFNLYGLTVANGNGFLSSGGLYNAGHTVVISSSTFIHNFAASGAHVKNDFGGTMTIVNSTFFDVNNGTAIGNVNGTLTIYNSTIDGNNATASNGLSSSSGTVTLYNTIVSNNAGVDCNGTITADAFNLDNDGTCDNATSKTVAEIALQPLANNGGATFTMALGSGSAALESGDDAVCAAAPVNNLDQRGVARPQNTICDVGAYEAWRLHISAVVPADVSLTWEAANIGCTYDVFESTTPYFTPLTPTYLNALSGDVINGRLGNPAINYFFINGATCGGITTAFSNEVGEFDFAIVPGS